VGGTIGIPSVQPSLANRSKITSGSSATVMRSAMVTAPGRLAPAIVSVAILTIAAITGSARPRISGCGMLTIGWRTYTAGRPGWPRLVVTMPYSVRNSSVTIVAVGMPRFSNSMLSWTLHDAIQERSGPGIRVVEEADDSTLEGWNALGQWHGIPGDRSDRREQLDRSHLRDTSLSIGAPATVWAWGPCPVERLAPGEDNICESTSRRPPGLQHRKGGLAAQHIVRGRVPASDAAGADD